MATFKFGRAIDLHWNGYDIQGPAETVFSIPDQLYEEFDADIAPVEPTLVWIDTNEFQTLENSVVTSTIIGSAYVSVASQTSGTTIALKSGSATSGYVLTSDGAGGQSYLPAPGGTGSLAAVVGTSPISVSTASGTATVSISQSSLSVGDASTASTLRTYVKNSSGFTIGKGQAVYIVDADGTNVLIDLASASAEATSSKTLGLTASSIANNDFGYVIESGYITGLNTATVAAGSSVWLGENAGSLVYNSPPAEPNHSVYLGVVARSNINNGEILVKVQNGYELDELHNVSAGTPSDLDIIQYKDSSGMWTKASISNAGIAASTHTHAYQDSGTYVNAVIGTSPVSVSTASGTSTVSVVAGSINSSHLSTNSVGTSQIIDGAVASAELATGAVTSIKIAAGAVDSAALASNAVVAAKIAASQITSGHISTGAVGSAALATAAVVSSAIATGAVTSGHIAAGAVGSAQIAAGAVVAGDIAASAVTSGNIAAGAVGSAAIATGSINSTHLATSSVGSTQLIDQSVTTGKIGSGSAASATVLTANGSGGASFAALLATTISAGTYTTSVVNGSVISTTYVTATSVNSNTPAIAIDETNKILFQVTDRRNIRKIDLTANTQISTTSYTTMATNERIMDIAFGAGKLIAVSGPTAALGSALYYIIDPTTMAIQNSGNIKEAANFLCTRSLPGVKYDDQLGKFTMTISTTTETTGAASTANNDRLTFRVVDPSTYSTRVHTFGTVTRNTQAYIPNLGTGSTNGNLALNTYGHPIWVANGSRWIFPGATWSFFSDSNASTSFLTSTGTNTQSRHFHDIKIDPSSSSAYLYAARLNNGETYVANLYAFSMSALISTITTTTPALSDAWNAVSQVSLGLGVTGQLDVRVISGTTYVLSGTYVYDGIYGGVSNTNGVTYGYNPLAVTTGAALAGTGGHFNNAYIYYDGTSVNLILTQVATSLHYRKVTLGQAVTWNLVSSNSNPYIIGRSTSGPSGVSNYNVLSGSGTRYAANASTPTLEISAVLNGESYAVKLSPDFTVGGTSTASATQWVVR